MSVISSPSPIPRPRSASPVYSHKVQKPSPHIMYKPDMIRSYSASSTPSSTLTPSQAQAQAQVQPLHTHNLLISILQGIGGVGVILFLALLWLIRGERSRGKKNKQKIDYEGVHIYDYTQQINPTAYNKLHLIRRASSNSLASGNVSPV